MSTAEKTAIEKTDDQGAEVWCPDGHGNRILDVGESFGFPCPVCAVPMVEEKPGPTGTLVEIRLPEVGRIVLVTLSPNTVRPAIVMGRNDDGRCLLFICRHPDDPSLAGVGNGHIAVLSFGEGIGQWQWPEKGTPQFVELYV